MNVAKQLIRQHLVAGEMVSGEEIGLRIDQTLTQDATGTLVMLELEAMQIERAKTEVSVQYVDHNLLQQDNKNPDDHIFLQSACKRFGVWFSRPGNGVSHPVHQEKFGIPGKTLLGSDSHTCAAGAIGMLAMGAGGLEVAMAMAGQPFYVKMPKIWGVNLKGKLPAWVSAKDVILEMLRRHGVNGGVGRIIEYYGDGLNCLSAMDRHVIANMGAELGATTTVFPSDGDVRRFLKSCGREAAWTEIVAEDAEDYDVHDEIDLSKLEPLIAMPSSPGNVLPVREVAGQPIYQAYVGSSANPGYRDFAIVAAIVDGKVVDDRVSLDINPTSRRLLCQLVRDGSLEKLISAGARIHQAGCNGCIGMGQAPATDKISLRTVPRNFPGRSGTPEDRVCLVSPETAAASALLGTIADPRGLHISFPKIDETGFRGDPMDKSLFEAPADSSGEVELIKGPNISSLPESQPLPDELCVPVLLKVGDNVSTDEIMPAGARVLPYRSNIERISDFAFEPIDSKYPSRAKDVGDHAIVGGSNYGQGSSREHAAMAPRYLGLRIVIAKSFARIHWQNLINFGVLPLTLMHEDDYSQLSTESQLRIVGLPKGIRAGAKLTLVDDASGKEFDAEHQFSPRQCEVVLRGGLVNWVRERLASHSTRR